MFHAFRRLAYCHCTFIALELRITLWYAREKHFGSKKIFRCEYEIVSSRAPLLHKVHIRRPSNQTAMVALRDTSIYVQVGGEVERGGEREGWEEGGKEGGATTHARPAFSASYHLSSSSSSSPSVWLLRRSSMDVDDR